MSLGSCIIVVQSLSCVHLFATPWTAAHQASLSLTVSWSLFRLPSMESVMPSSHHTLYRPLLLLPSIFASIRVFSSESVLHIRWPKYWSFSFSISPSNEYSWLISLICIYVYIHMYIIYIHIWKIFNFFLYRTKDSIHISSLFWLKLWPYVNLIIYKF